MASLHHEVKPLPPKNVDYSVLLSDLGEARASIGQLEGSLANPRVKRELLVTPFMTKEAVQSSAIEGTVASLEDVMRYEASHKALESEELRNDAQEIINYRKALDAAMEELQQRAIGENLLKKSHFVLMDSVRGQGKRRGEFRRGPVWVGKKGAPIEEATYVPPKAEDVRPLMKNWEEYINSRDETDPTIQIAIAHYQFEAIHPFMDGNGRVGRMVIPLFLCERGLLSAPVLYVSEYFEAARDEYLDALRAVDNEGNWVKWIKFFLRAATVQAGRTLNTLLDVEELYEELSSRVDGFGLAYGRPMLDLIFKQPIVTSKYLKDNLDASGPTVYRLLERFSEAELINEVTQRERNRIYVFGKLLGILR